MIEWVINNKEWVFSGFGVILIIGLIKFLRGEENKRAPETINSQPVSITNQNIVNMESSAGGEPNKKMINPNSLKAVTHILFIDDDQKFKVVDILKKSGWSYTRRVSDIGSIDDSIVQQAHILFIDVQGVGRRLKFKDEGLGLALAIKDKYPGKKIVIWISILREEIVCFS